MNSGVEGTPPAVDRDSADFPFPVYVCVERTLAMKLLMDGRPISALLCGVALLLAACATPSLDNPPDSPSCAGSPLSGGTQRCSVAAQGNLPGGFQWSIWSSGAAGCITPYNVGTAFKATWNESGDFLARAGYQWNSTQTWDQLGTITADYAFTRSGTGGDFSYIGVYGWSRNPLVEYYIVEDWFTKPNPGTRVGTITVDGDTYTVYKNTRTNAASIEGTSTFDQFFSVRQKSRQCGHVSVSAHFAEWAKLGLDLGKMYEAKILAEAGGGAGAVDFTSATMAMTK